MKKVLVLRTCNADMSSHSEYARGFKWPESGPVECDDWDPKPECGYGLHGLLWGEGWCTIVSLEKDAKWLVVEVLESDIVQLCGKVKFPRGEVVFCGGRDAAVAYLVEREPDRATCFKISSGGKGSTNTGGNDSKNTGGDDSKNTGGKGSTNTGGDYSTNTGGNYSTNTGGKGSTNTGGDYSTNTGGNYSKNTGGDDSKNTGGNDSTNTGGNYSTNTGGDYSTNTGGNDSTNTGGDYSTNTGGKGSTLVFYWCDGKRNRAAVAYVGEDGIEPNKPYKCVKGKVVPA